MTRTKPLHNLTTYILALLICLSLIGLGTLMVQAEDSTAFVANNLLISGDADGFTHDASARTVTFTKAGTYSLSQNPDVYGSDTTLIINGSGSFDITLDNVNIQAVGAGESEEGISAIQIENGDLTLRTRGTVNIYGGTGGNSSPFSSLPKVNGTGGHGIRGDVTIINEGTLTIKGGAGGYCTYSSYTNEGAEGGHGIDGNLTLSGSGTTAIYGGSGGKGSGYGSNASAFSTCGGDGGDAIHGSLIANETTISVYGGNGGGNSGDGDIYVSAGGCGISSTTRVNNSQVTVEGGMGGVGSGKYADYTDNGSATYSTVTISGGRFVGTVHDASYVLGGSLDFISGEATLIDTNENGNTLSGSFSMKGEDSLIAFEGASEGTATLTDDPKGNSSYFHAYTLTKKQLGGFVIEAKDESHYTYENGILTLVKDGYYIISMTSGEDEVAGAIVVNTTGDVTLTLKDLTLVAPDGVDGLSCVSGNVTLQTKGTVSLTGGVDANGTSGAFSLAYGSLEAKGGAGGKAFGTFPTLPEGETVSLTLGATQGDATTGTQYTDEAYASLSLLHTITFSANGAEGEMESITMVAGTFTLPAPLYVTPDGKHFDCWALDASGINYVYGSIEVTSSITLYAIWEDHYFSSYSDDICSCGVYNAASLIEDPESPFFGYYEITSAGKLLWYSANGNGKHAVLTSDVRIYSSYIAGTDFAGVLIPEHTIFEGNGHQISFSHFHDNYYLEEGTYHIALFDARPGATIQNLVVDGSLDVNTSGMVGGVVADASGVTLKQVVSSVRVDNKGNGKTGILVGYIGASTFPTIIENCGVYRMSSSDTATGGIVGFIASDVTSTTISNVVAYCDYIYEEAMFGAIVGVSEASEHAANVSIRNAYYLKDLSAYVSIAAPFALEELHEATEEEFRQGKVTYLLGTPWGQDLSDTYYFYPQLGMPTVYYGYFTCHEDVEAVYTNDANVHLERPSHDFDEVTHVCSVCSKTETFTVKVTEEPAGDVSAHITLSTTTATYGTDFVAEITCAGANYEVVGFIIEGYDSSEPYVKAFTVNQGTITLPAAYVVGNMQLVAYPVATVTFDTAGGTPIDAITAPFGTPLTAPTAPTKEGHDFMGWSADIPTTMGLDDITLTALWKAHVFTVTVTEEPAGDTSAHITLSTTTATYGTDFVAEITCAGANYEVVGFIIEGYDSSEPYVKAFTVNQGTITLPAAYVVGNMQLVAYPVATVTFDTAGGTPIDAITAPFGTPLTAPTAPTKEGHDFMGWSADLPTTMGLDDITLTALWKVHVHADADENRICDNCGDEIPRDGLSGGAITGIVLGSTGVVGIGGFSLFWFVIKKKKFSDLIASFKK